MYDNEIEFGEKVQRESSETYRDEPYGETGHLVILTVTIYREKYLYSDNT